MLKLDTPIQINFSKFFNWWSSELSFLIPARLKKYLGHSGDHLLLRRDEQGIEVIHREGDTALPLGRFLANEAGRAARNELLADAPDLADLKVVLQLTAAQALRKTVKLPLQAEENLNQVMAFEMDRLTPFKSNRVYFAGRVISRSPATRQITVEAMITPRDKLDAMIDELAALGWHPDRVGMEGDASVADFDLLPEKYRRNKGRWYMAANVALACLIGLFLLAFLVMPVWSKHKTLEQLQAESKAVGKVAQEVEQLRQDSDKLRHETRFLQERKRDEPVLVDMLEELSRVIPDNTWLNGMQYKDRRIVIQGQSPSASSLIALIEASDYFKNTSFVSPVTKDTSNGLERFQIASDVLNGRFVTKAAPAPAQ